MEQEKFTELTPMQKLLRAATDEVRKDINEAVRAITAHDWETADLHLDHAMRKMVRLGNAAWAVREERKGDQ